MAKPRIVVIGTRGSALARAQTGWVAGRLRALYPELRFEIHSIATRGDVHPDDPLTDIGSPGIFVKEIERALLRGEIDLGVHSLKDLLTEEVPGLTIAAVPTREDPRDAWVSDAETALADLPPGSRVGTGSIRRRALLLAQRPDLRVEGIRGNVDTRLRKLDAGEYEGLILAVAGLRRLDLAGRITARLPLKFMLPAVGQGALALQVRADDEELADWLEPLNDRSTAFAVGAERAFLRAMGGGCAVPVTAHARVSGERLTLRALAATPDGRKLVRRRLEGPKEDPEELGRRMADAILTSEARTWLHEAVRA